MDENALALLPADCARHRALVLAIEDEEFRGNGYQAASMDSSRECVFFAFRSSKLRVGDELRGEATWMG